ncbi:MAG: chorismate synthase [Clostridia bacterium]|nr:chorismate synthase [Clostridia bacterium]
MKNTYGNSVSITIAGESHGEGICVILDGIKAGVRIDEDFIKSQLSLRRPQGKESTQRSEADNFRLISGVFNGYSTGTSICILIENTSQHSKDYSATRFKARPGHADYTAHIKYKGYEDYRGGGHFSGRITSGIVAAGAIAISMLRDHGIEIATHIKRCGKTYDRDFGDFTKDFAKLQNTNFPVLDDGAESAMRAEIIEAKMNLDSIGGILETAVTGIPTGLGEPWFDSVESRISHMMFSVPGIKGIEFGAGFSFADMHGSEANDAFCVENGRVQTVTNNNGGINGGIANGMPILFRCAVKPTPSIAKEQKTIDMQTMENTEIQIVGRHDPSIVHRAAVVVNSATALCILDMMAERFGNEF